METLIIHRRRWEPTPEQLTIIKAMLNGGKGQSEIAKLFGIGVSTLGRVMRENKLEYQGKPSQVPREKDPTPKEIKEKTEKFKRKHLQCKRESEGPYDDRHGNPKVCKMYKSRFRMKDD